LTIIRPLVYLTEETVAAVHRRLDLPCLAVTCPHGEGNMRARYKAALSQLAGHVGEPRLARRVVEALERSDPWPEAANCHVEDAGRDPHGCCGTDGPIAA
jgi:hypothetical protein